MGDRREESGGRSLDCLKEAAERTADLYDRGVLAEWRLDRWGLRLKMIFHNDDINFLLSWDTILKCQDLGGLLQTIEENALRALCRR